MLKPPTRWDCGHENDGTWLSSILSWTAKIGAKIIWMESRWLAMMGYWDRNVERDRWLVHHGVIAQFLLILWQFRGIFIISHAENIFDREIVKPAYSQFVWATVLYFQFSIDPKRKSKQIWSIQHNLQEILTWLGKFTMDFPIKSTIYRWCSLIFPKISPMKI